MTERIFENVKGPSRDFYIERGLNSDIARQLVVKSREPRIMEACPKDSAERFTDLEAIENWLAKGRTLYPLMNGANLAGAAWYGPKKLPIYFAGPEAPNHTFAIRIYASYNGRGLAEPFMDETLKDYLWNVVEGTEPFDFQGLWLSAAADNARALELYQRYGYEELGSTPEEVFMVLSDSKIREIVGA